MHIKTWIDTYNIDATINNRIVTVPSVGVFCVVYPVNNQLFNANFDLLVTQTDKAYAEKFNSDYWLFFFGERWYYTKDTTNVQLTPFIYLGNVNQQLANTFPYLGIRGKYELMNGTRHYEDWCKKARFLGYTTLGLVEHNTLAGALSFQLACQKFNIKPILGVTLTIVWDDESLYLLKFFAINDMGWKTLLLMLKTITVDGKSGINVDELFNSRYGGGCLICVLPTNINLGDKRIKQLQQYYWKVYYQLDLVEWGDRDTDQSHLHSVETYLNKYTDLIEPILLNDTFYLEQNHSHIKFQLNNAAKSPFQRYSRNQHFKNADELWSEYIALFNKQDYDYARKIFQQAVASTQYVGKLCNFTIDLESLHLPKYEMTELEAQYFDDNQKLFLHYIKRGFASVPKKDQSKYQQRIYREMEVIVNGGFVDYFLILADIVRWSKQNNILTGIGRGSAGGSLIAFLMGITRLDPMKYDLLFERFLNESRLPKTVKVDLVEVQTDEGVVVLNVDQRIQILRNKQSMYVLARQLQNDDKIITY